MYVFNKDLLKKKLKESKMTYLDLADEMTSRGVEITENGVKWWFREDKNKPELDKIKIIAEILNIEINDLVEQDIFLTKNDVKQVPIVGEVSCGDPIKSDYQDNDFIFVSVEIYDESLYALRACGDSMSPEIEDGDILTCDPNTELIDGDLVHYQVLGESAVKVYIYDDEKSMYIFKPINQAPYFQTKYVPKDDETFADLKMAKVVMINKDTKNNRARRLREVGM